MIWVEELEPKQREDALDGKGTSINEITIEQIRILLRWQAINLKNVKEIIKLSMYITTHGKFLVIWNWDINESWLRTEVCLDVT